MSQCFTLFIYGGLCHLSSLKQCSVNLIFLVYSLIDIEQKDAYFLSLYYYRIDIVNMNILSFDFFPKTSWRPFKFTVSVQFIQSNSDVASSRPYVITVSELAAQLKLMYPIGRLRHCKHVALSPALPCCYPSGFSLTAHRFVSTPNNDGRVRDIIKFGTRPVQRQLDN